MKTNLTNEQKDYARFLPALSGFYATYVGKQRFDEYVETSRIPTNLKNGVESLNYINQNEGQFQYKWTLYSAGHAELDINKDAPKAFIDEFNNFNALVRDNKKFEINSVKLLYSLPINSFTLINDEENNIYLAMIKNFRNENIDTSNDNFNEFINKQNSNNKKSILKSYDMLLSDKYNITLNQKTIERVKNYFL